MKKHLDKERFELIKTLQKNKVKSGQIKGICKVSSSTVYKVSKAEDYATYLADKRANRKKREVLSKPIILPQENGVKLEIVGEIQKTNRLLEALINEIRDNKGFKPFKSLFR